MNYFAVCDRKAAGLSKIVWPRDHTLHRGGRLPAEHAEWYRRAAEAGLVYRVNFGLSTSESKASAIDFMLHYSYPEDEKRVHYVFHLDKDYHCMHVNCLEHLTIAE